jgi:hypothetical protein
MSHEAMREIAYRKALLATRAELDRARLTLAVHDVKAIVAPPRDASRAAAARPAAAMLVTFATPLLGRTRLGHWLRIASYALAAWRIARRWRVGSSR